MPLTFLATMPDRVARFEADCLGARTGYELAHVQEHPDTSWLLCDVQVAHMNKVPDAAAWAQRIDTAMTKARKRVGHRAI